MIPPPGYTFQKMVSDIFEFKGHYCRVYTDCLTGSVELENFLGSTASLMIFNIFCEFFHRWGVPQKISLDESTNIMSNEVKTWFKIILRLFSTVKWQS